MSHQRVNVRHRRSLTPSWEIKTSLPACPFSAFPCWPGDSAREFRWTHRHGGGLRRRGRPLVEVAVGSAAPPLRRGLLLLVLTPRPTTARVLGIAALLLATVSADLSMAMLIARGAVKGDWWLPVILAVIPAMGVVYALPLALMRQPPRTD